MTTFRGVLPALPTPFAADGATVDEPALRALVDRCVDAGAGGLVPTGSTGEFTTLTAGERRAVVEVTLAAADGRVPTVPGTGALSTAETVALSRHAEQAGAAAVMVVPPFYEAPGWDELLAHFAAVADAIAIPTMYYNLPAATGVTLTPAQLVTLREQARVTCLKDTGGDAAAAAAVRATPGAPTLLNGYDTLTFGALAAGAEACVWGCASILPDACVRLHRLLLHEHDLVAARELWAALYPVNAFLESRPYAAAVKAGCALTGLDAGPVRAPARDLVAADRETLRGLLTAVGAAAPA